MKVRLQQKDLTEVLVEIDYPHQYQSLDQGGITEKIFSARLLGGVGKYRVIYTEHIHIGYGDVEMSEFTELAFEADFESVEMHFSLLGGSEAIDSETNHAYRFGANQHNIIYAKSFRGNSNFPKKMKIFEINFTPDFFKKFLPDTGHQFYQFLKNINHQQNTLLSKHNLKITPQMHLIIQEILGCTRVGIFKKLFLEAKVIELLLLQLEQMNEQSQATPYFLRKADIEKMYAVKEIIENNLDSSYTLIDLSRQVGTNEYTLKKGFKEIFGTTVFGFWHELKMQQAKRMLLEEGLAIHQVADSIGYRNPQHFSTAFKKRFGVLPSFLKK